MAIGMFGHDALGSDYESVRLIQDASIGLRCVLSIHSTRLGPAAGGIRRTTYADDRAAFNDALALSAMMTAKCAIADLPAGGGKTVIMDHPDLDVEAAYHRIGLEVEAIGGRYLCGPDVGTGEDQLRALRKVTKHVNAPGNDAGASTALGVVSALHAVMARLDDDPSFEGRRFVVQGLGSVGFAVAKALVDGGGDVVGADVSTMATEHAEAAGIPLITPERTFTTDCDVFVPCAMGGVFTERVARTVPCRAVCGSANNQLAEDTAGIVLHRRRILYAPDFVVNAGAAIEGVLTNIHGATDKARTEARHVIEGTGDRLGKVFDGADALRERPEAVAFAMARDRVARG